jgi:hypothetical protein
MISASYCTKIRDILIHSCLIFAFRDEFPERERGVSGFGCSGGGKGSFGFGCSGAGEKGALGSGVGERGKGSFGFGCSGAGEKRASGMGVRSGKKMAGPDAPVRELQANRGPGSERVGGGRGDEKLGPRKTIK